MTKRREIAPGLILRHEKSGKGLSTREGKILATPIYLGIDWIGKDTLFLRRRNVRGIVVYDIFYIPESKIVVKGLQEIPINSALRR